MQTPGDEAFRKRLLTAFQGEAADHLRAISTGLLELEKAPAGDEEASLVEGVFREAHSLKGAARAANMVEIEAICQALESIFASWKRGTLAPSPGFQDALYMALDTMGRMLTAPEGERPAISGLIHDLTRMGTGAAEAAEAPRAEQPAPSLGLAPVSPGPDAPAPAAPSPPHPLTPSPLHPIAPSPPAPNHPGVAATVRIATAKLDSMLLKAEEMVALKLAAGQRLADLRQAEGIFDAWSRDWARVQPDVRAALPPADGDGHVGSAGRSREARLAQALERSHQCIQALESRIAGVRKVAEQDRRGLCGMVDGLLDEMKQALMLPFSALLDSLPRMVRDIARDQGKEIDLVVQGGDVEIDKRILEEMKDPLIHLLRNCIDHGVEIPEERARLVKPPRGTITLTVSQATVDRVEVVVADDGAGIDAAKVRAAAANRGIARAREVGDDSDEALALVFESEVSTSPIITELSGRGLGLAIVREKVGRLGGAVSLETQVGAGTSFHLLLPVTLATFGGVLVRVGSRLFIIPSAGVERVLRVRREEIRSVEGKEVIQVGDEVVSLGWLHRILELPAAQGSADEAGFIPFLVIRASEQRVAVGVDEIHGEQEVLVKALGKQLRRVRNIAGATVLGSGKVVPILHTPDLVRSAVRATADRRDAAAGGERAAAPSILVAEDSITSRMLLRSILEMAGYRVRTAVDGLDALTALREDHFDLLVSDVEMPRMDGFDLTARVRGEKALSELPVILVTALESREDREHGIDVGANAYIAKSSFDHTSLLEAIQRLV